jgi:hypothetical protein
MLTRTKLARHEAVFFRELRPVIYQIQEGLFWDLNKVPKILYDEKME